MMRQDERIAEAELLLEVYRTRRERASRWHWSRHAVLGSPLNALARLANTLGALGVELHESAVVLRGSISRSVPASSGETITRSFAGLQTLTARFA